MIFIQIIQEEYSTYIRNVILVVARQKNMQSQQGKETEFYILKHNPLGFFFYNACVCMLATIADATSYMVVNAAKHDRLSFSY